MTAVYFSSSAFDGCVSLRPAVVINLNVLTGRQQCPTASSRFSALAKSSHAVGLGGGTPEVRVAELGLLPYSRKEQMLRCLKRTKDFFLGVHSERSELFEGGR